MIWAILALLGVPLWLCALGIAALVFRSRSLSHRVDNVAVRVLRPGHDRWRRGNGIWVANVFAWRGSPAAWAEDLVPVTSLVVRPATDDERTHLRRLGDEPVVAVLTSSAHETITVAAAARDRTALQGPYVTEHVA